MKVLYFVVGGVAVAGAGVGAYFLLRKPAPPPPPPVQPGVGGSLCDRVATVAVQAGIAAGSSSQGVPPGAIPPGVAPASASLLCNAGSAVAQVVAKGAVVVAKSVAGVGTGIADLFSNNYQSCEAIAAAQGLTGAAAAASARGCETSRAASKAIHAVIPGLGQGTGTVPTTAKLGGVAKASAPGLGRR